MTKKKLLKEKHIRKKEEITSRETIINSYMDKIKCVLDDSYLQLTALIEDFNNKLMKSAIEYSKLKIEVDDFIRNINDDNFERFKQTISKAINIEQSIKEEYDSFISRNTTINPVKKMLGDITIKIARIIEMAQITLGNQKNSAYIISLLTNRSFKKIEEYNDFIIEISEETNDYIDAYTESRERFVESIIEIKQVSEEKALDMVIEFIDLNELDKPKYKERLRIDYYELENFLIHKGYEKDRQNSTTHSIWKHKELGTSVTFPNKSKTIPQGTMSRILRQMGCTRQELAQYLRGDN